MPVIERGRAASAGPSPAGLSPHARALWRRADNYRRLADKLADDTARGTVRP